MTEYKDVYLILFFLSLIFIFSYMRMYTKQHGLHYIVFGVLGCIVNLSFYYAALAETGDELLLASMNVYSAMVFVPVVILRMVCDICNEKRPFLRDIPILISTLILISMVTNQKFGLFYKVFEKDPITGDLNVVFGVTYYLYFAHIAASLAEAILLLVKKRKEGNVSVFCFFCVEGMAYMILLTSIVILIFPNGLDFLPVGIICADIWMLILCRRLPLYDVSTAISEAEEAGEQTGILLLDKKRRLLGYNSVMAEIPGFTACKIDAVLPETFNGYDELDLMIRELDKTGNKQTKIVSSDENYYQGSLDHLRMNRRICGYQLILTDVTDQQNYIHLINNYNTQLEGEVRKKTENIVKMQDTILLGIAELVESRDDSTGGHIKRTKKVIEILVDELRKDNVFDKPKTFYDMLIKAAPLHDLGKIAVDDAVLRKPGKFTPEEFEQMKRHAPEGGKMTRKVLEDINDEEMVSIVTNVANYHHERWDGSGYPEKLKGESIPIEARIMAVADVYDALVSRRCYKEAFDFEKARNIITEGMGSQFDPHLSDVFAKCVSRLEEYYSQEQEMEEAQTE